MSIRSVGKRLVEWALCEAGAPRLGALLRRRGTLVLAYHNIVPDAEAPCGDVTLHLSRKAFAQQLDHLQRTHEIVPIGRVFDGDVRPSARPCAAITFDDAYMGAVSEGVEELVSRGVPGTIFAAPAWLGGNAFWWDEFADAERGSLDRQLRRMALGALAGRQDLIHAWAAREGRRPQVMPPFARTATEGDLQAASARPGITVGSHSWSHPNLSGLDPNELREEVTRPLDWLRARVPTTVPVLAYPYGFSTLSSRRAAAAAGYDAAFHLEGGWVASNQARSARFALPRADIPSGLSLEGFRLRVSGLLRV